MGGFVNTILALSTGGLSTLLTSGNKQDSGAPQPPKTPHAPNPEDSQVKADENAKRRRGQTAQTVYTSPLGAGGISNTTQAGIVKKTLLGQ